MLLGIVLGRSDGPVLVLGAELGSDDGFVEILGIPLGFCDGSWLGCNEGSDDGCLLGIELG